MGYAGKNVQYSGWIFFLSSKKKPKLSYHWIDIKPVHVKVYETESFVNENGKQDEHVWHL